MNYPFIEGISDIQQTQAMTGSRSTIQPFSPRSILSTQNLTLQTCPDDLDDLLSDPSPEPQFYSLYSYTSQTLSTWNLPLPPMSESPQNLQILQTICALIQHRFSSQQRTQHLQQTLSQCTFKKNQYQSLLHQQRNSNLQKDKNIGRLENLMGEIQNKNKKNQLGFKKEKEEDKKVIAMLRSKNQQLMHEIKKKEQETNRVKEQMKRNVGEKSALKNVNFEVYQISQKQQGNLSNDKYQLLNQKYESERKAFMRQNVLLRQKISDIRDEIVQFAEWIDRNVFKQKCPDYKNKMLVNHNMLFKKQSLTSELSQILQSAKSGIDQILSLYTQSLSSKSQPLTKKPSQNAFKKPVQGRGSEGLANGGSLRNSQDLKNSFKGNTLQVRKKKNDDEMHGVSFKEQESQISMISHVSAEDIINQNQKLKKWDILFND